MIVWTRRIQFWEPWEIKFHQMTENVSLNLQKDQKKLFTSPQKAVSDK